MTRDRLRAPLLALTFALAACAGDEAASPLVDAGADETTTDDGRAAGDVRSAPSCQRWVLDEVTNARGLGELDLGQGGRVACGRVLRGGHLGGLGAAGCAELEALGIRSVLDLRERATQTSSPPPACVTERATHVDLAMPKLLPPTTSTYLALLDEKQAIAGLFASLGMPERYPAYIHCVIGRDRASVATALVLLALGATPKAVLDEFLLSNDRGVTVDATWLEAVLDELDARGGVSSYLTRDCGVTKMQLETLRRQVLEPS